MERWTSSLTGTGWASRWVWAAWCGAARKRNVRNKKQRGGSQCATSNITAPTATASAVWCGVAAQTGNSNINIAVGNLTAFLGLLRLPCASSVCASCHRSPLMSWRGVCYLAQCRANWNVMPNKCRRDRRTNVAPTFKLFYRNYSQLLILTIIFKCRLLFYAERMLDVHKLQPVLVLGLASWLPCSLAGCS